jgi:hypothetical protein
VKQDILNIGKLVEKKETKKLSKMLLIPIRFIHSIYESTLPSCENAVASFISRENDKDKVNLINFALELRSDLSTLEKYHILRNTSENLIKIYHDFFSAYHEKLISLNQTKLAKICQNAAETFK